ncbi:MAG: hypothetical protein JNL88_06465 [Bacteroidia bacterium]|nr:hypothetical protein [Bacteroidia bacterium]
MKPFLLLLISLCFSPGASAQSAPEALQLLREVNQRFSRVKDYQADALIDARISFLKILPQKARVYFKQPDKFRLKSKGIAILPRQGFDQLFRLTANENDFIAFISGTETLEGSLTTLVNVIPRADTSDLVLAKLWIDTNRDLILKSQLTTRSNGTIVIDYSHGSHSEYALPDQAVFTVEVKKFKIPKAVTADINSSASVKPAGKEPKTGKIIIRFTNYSINRGVPEEIFLK